MTNTELLDNLYELSRKNETDAALDLLFEEVDEAFLAGEFVRVDQFLRLVNPNRLNTSVRVGVLVAANWAQTKLPYYKTLYDKMVASVDQTNKAELFAGLEPK